MTGSGSCLTVWLLLFPHLTAEHDVRPGLPSSTPGGRGSDRSGSYRGGEEGDYREGRKGTDKNEEYINQKCYINKYTN